MSTNPSAVRQAGSFFASFRIQMQVIGALMMRELHTRYGRENIGYVWLIGEPFMLASVISSLHANGHSAVGSDIRPLPFAVLGYTSFIMFRGIVNRSEGSMEANQTLLYHRMVTAFDVTISRGLIEAAGTLSVYFLLIGLMTSLGWASWPYRPLYFFASQALEFWWAFSHSLIIAGLSYENRTFGRMVHPYVYFAIPFSGAFYQVAWIPEKYRVWLLWYPMPHIFELARYGQFRSASLKYVDIQYVVFVCAVMTILGLLAIKFMRQHVHLRA